MMSRFGSKRTASMSKHAETDGSRKSTSKRHSATSGTDETEPEFHRPPSPRPELPGIATYKALLKKNKILVDKLLRAPGILSKPIAPAEDFPEMFQSVKDLVPKHQHNLKYLQTSPKVHRMLKKCSAIAARLEATDDEELAPPYSYAIVRFARELGIDGAVVDRHQLIATLNLYLFIALAITLFLIFPYMYMETGTAKVDSQNNSQSLAVPEAVDATLVWCAVFAVCSPFVLVRSDLGATDLRLANAALITFLNVWLGWTVGGADRMAMLCAGLTIGILSWKHSRPAGKRMPREDRRDKLKAAAVLDALQQLESRTDECRDVAKLYEDCPGAKARRGRRNAISM